MWASSYTTLVVLCGVLSATACSNPIGPITTGPSGEWWITTLSTNQVAVGDSVTVTVTVINPTTQQLTLVYGSPITDVEAQQGSTTFGPDLVALDPQTIALAPGAQTSLQPLVVHILPTGVSLPEAFLTLAPGVYGLAGCVAVWHQSPDNGGWIETPGPFVNFTVTQ
jgi:hypothetical protein